MLSAKKFYKQLKKVDIRTSYLLENLKSQFANEYDDYEKTEYNQFGNEISKLSDADFGL